MTNKFTIDELMIKVMPGGFFLAVILFVARDYISFNLTDNLDFLYTFFFFCSAFIIGELLQTLAHELEGVIDIFFKCRRPSEIFLYKKNPILKNEYKREELIKSLNLTKGELKIFNKNYSEISSKFWKKEKKEDNLSQSVFWKLYSQVSSTEEIKISNRNYLFTRVIMVEFLIISICLFSYQEIYLGIISIIIFLIFLRRSRGVARGLVFKTILLNLKK